MAFLEVMGRRIYSQTDSKFLKVFRMMKLKMKLAYECWNQRLALQDIFSKAIEQTLEENQVLTIVAVQRQMLLDTSDGAPSYYSR